MATVLLLLTPADAARGYLFGAAGVIQGLTRPPRSARTKVPNFRVSVPPGQSRPQTECNVEYISVDVGFASPVAAQDGGFL